MVSSTSAADGVPARLSRSVGYRCFAHSPARCIEPSACWKRECSAVANTHQALWSWWMRRNRRGAVNKWRSGAGYLRPYMPVHRRVKLAPLVRAVDGYLEAMSGESWPELEMPTIDQE